MKKLLVYLCIVTSVTCIQAQEKSIFDFGIKAGGAYSRIRDLKYGHENIFVPSVTVYMEHVFKNNVALSLEGNYYRHGYTNPNGAFLNIDYAGYSLLVKRYMPNGVFSLVGFNISGSAAFELHYEPIMEENNILNEMLEVNNMILTIPTGVGYYFTESVFIQARWNIGITSLAKNYDYKPNLYSISLGFSF